MRRLVSDKNNTKWLDRPIGFTNFMTPMALPDGNGGFTSYPMILIIEKGRQDGILITIC
jgi:hypothetical protein